MRAFTNFPFFCIKKEVIGIDVVKGVKSGAKFECCVIKEQGKGNGLKYKIIVVTVVSPQYMLLLNTKTLVDFNKTNK